MFKKTLLADYCIQAPHGLSRPTRITLKGDNFRFFYVFDFHTRKPAASFVVVDTTNLSSSPVLLLQLGPISGSINFSLPLHPRMPLFAGFPLRVLKLPATNAVFDRTDEPSSLRAAASSSLHCSAAEAKRGLRRTLDKANGYESEPQRREADTKDGAQSNKRGQVSADTQNGSNIAAVRLDRPLQEV